MDKSTMLKDPISKLDHLMGQIGKLLTRSRKHILEQFGLTYSQFEMLSALSYFTERKKEIIQTDLSVQTYIDQMTTSTVLRNLEKKKLITRNRSTTNTRTVLIKITPKGQEVFEQASRKLQTVNNSIYKNIDSKDLLSQLLILSKELNRYK